MYLAWMQPSHMLLSNLPITIEKSAKSYRLITVNSSVLLGNTILKARIFTSKDISHTVPIILSISNSFLVQSGRSNSLNFQR